MASPPAEDHPGPLRTLHRTRLAWWLATFFGAGYLKPGPGTYASAITALLWLAAAHLAPYFTAHFTVPSPLPLALGTALAALLVTLAGIPAATRVAREAGREDPGFVVIDEVVGQLVALIGLSATWPEALLGLLLFRFFDILKPPPIRQLERLPEGTGIMLDDVAAGLLACVVAHAALDLLSRVH